MMHRPHLYRLSLPIGMFLLSFSPGCGQPNPFPQEEWKWNLPAGVSSPHVPDLNPMNQDKVRLGRFLFYDSKLSEHGALSCASCHDPKQGFADPRGISISGSGEPLRKNAPGLANVGYQKILTWANPTLGTLEAQALVPLFGDNPEELHAAGTIGAFLEIARDTWPYRNLFPAAFDGANDPFSVSNIGRAIAAFERSIVSFGSPFDRYLQGDSHALNPDAIRGKDLFFSDRFGCGSCHSGRNLTLAAPLEGPQVSDEPIMRNTGLYNLEGRGLYPSNAPGLSEFSGKASDHGKFRIPSLRNVSLTAPYMHDGSIPSLDQVLDHYAAGGRRLDPGTHSGDGRLNPYKDALIRGFSIDADERRALLAFLESLTDPTLATNQAYANPWLNEAE
jgi:cytochrome c peroxidase